MADEASLSDSQRRNLAVADAVVAAFPSPDTHTFCADNSLCSGKKCCPVKNKSGVTLTHLCCPYDSGVCCGAWCCPSHQTCNTNITATSPRLCLERSLRSAAPRGDPVSAPRSVVDPLSVVNPVSGTTRGLCPHGVQNPCDKGQTCCMQQDQTVTCSPFPNATCCEDGIHSCPTNYTCQPETNVCLPPEPPAKSVMDRVPLGKKRPASYRNVTDSNNSNISTIICDEEMECRNWETCCRLPDGGYGCCPFAKAVCCSDREHCCPTGHWCDKKTHLCVQPASGDMVAMGLVRNRVGEEKGGEIPLTDIIEGGMKNNELPLVPIQGKEEKAELPLAPITQRKKDDDVPITDVVCPDQSLCPSGTTCCQIQSGSYGCCPFSSAVCCSDKEHCCPENKTCNMAAGTCDSPGSVGSLPWAGIPLMEREEPIMKNDVTCEDESVNVNQICENFARFCPL
eukprot:sb/3464589/